MIGQAEWEKTLRRRLKKTSAGKTARKGHAAFDVIAITAFGAFLIAVLGFASVNYRGRMVAVTLVTGWLGSVMGRALRARWSDGAGLVPFAPTGVRGIRRLECRVAAPTLVTMIAMGLVMASLGCIAGGWSAVLAAIPVAVSAMATGMLFASGRWGGRILMACLVGALGWTTWEVVTTDLAPGSLTRGFLHAWPPAFAWSLWTGAAGHVFSGYVVFAIGLTVAVAEWRQAWRGGHTWEEWKPAVEEKESGDGETDGVSDKVKETVSGEKDTRPELRNDLRATVTRYWIGLAAYVPWQRFTWVDKILWRQLCPHERMLACLGAPESTVWSRRVLSAAGLLAVADALIWVAHLSSQGNFGAFMHEEGKWINLPAVGLLSLAWLRSSPRGFSTFKPWTLPFQPGFQRPVTPLAVFPVSPAVWLRCATKEWVIRAAMVALLWGLAVMIVAPAFFTGDHCRYLAICFVTPWIWLGSLFPFSVGGQLLRAYCGDLRGINANSWTFLSLVLMLIGPAAAVVAVIAMVLNHLPFFAAALVLAASAAWCGMKLAMVICRNMRRDVAPVGSNI